MLADYHGRWEVAVPDRRTEMRARPRSGPGACEPIIPRWSEHHLGGTVALPSVPQRWRHSPLWVKLLALILVPLVAAGALCVVVAGDRMARNQDAGRISQLAQLAQNAYVVSDDLYYDGYIMSAQAELGAFLALAPTLEQSLTADQTRLIAEVRRQAAAVRAAGTGEHALAGELAKMDGLLARQSRAHQHSAALAHQLVDLAYGIWVVADQAMGTMSALAVGLSGSSDLGAQIQAVQQVAGVNGDIQAVLVTIFGEESVPLGLARARVEGQLQAQLTLANNDLDGAASNTSAALSQWRRRAWPPTASC